MQAHTALRRSISFAPAAVALAVATQLLAPGREAAAFSTLGGSLSAEAQRDFRLFNNFADATTNNNTDVDPRWPGWDGAELAVWKGAMEWSSQPHGNGQGDPLQSTIGDGGANFDFYWAGTTTGVGGTNDNIVSATSSCGAGTLAFVETPISDGWRMRFCDGAGLWSDGPGNVTAGEGGLDLQGVGTHEFGHSLGLGHSSVPSAVMFPTTVNGIGQRNLDPDDIAGVQFIYGARSASKPEIDSAVVDLVANTVTITGTGFSTTGNEVRFTNAASTSTGSDPHLRVTNVASTGGGTQIVVTLPATAGSGDVMVKQSGTGHSTLSNAFPVDLDNGGSTGGDPDAEFTAGATSGPTPLTVQFTDLSGGTGLASWSWDFGDGGSSSVRSPSHVYMTAGTFDVSLTVVGTNGSETETKLAFITATEGAACFDRPGSGSNLQGYACANTPILGGLWIGSVDGTSVGASGLSVLVGFGAPLPAPFPTSFGELLVNPASGLVFSDTTSIATGIAGHFLSIPSDASLDGVTAYTQVFLTGVGVLTNGVDLRFGF